MIIESSEGMENRILPDTSVVLAFMLKGTVRHIKNNTVSSIPLSVLTGLKNSPRLVQYAPEAVVLLVLFNDCGAPAFFAEPVHDFFESTVSLLDIWGQQSISEIEEKLMESDTDKARVNIIEEFLCSRLQNYTLDKLVKLAVQKIKMAHGNIRIKELTMVLGTSTDPFEKRFRKITGASPKQFATIVRLRKLISVFSQTQTLTDAAYEAGYFDQSHFIKSFKAFTGQTPAEFFRFSRYW